MDIKFVAYVAKVSTTVDGGWSITLDVSEDEAANVMRLSVMRNRPLTIAVTGTPNELFEMEPLD